jgi:putative transposase
MGRDAFEALCRQERMTVSRNVNYRRTTDSSGVVRFENLLGGKITTGINQVWQSDITYFEVSNVFYYLTFIIDAHSRRIIGHSVSRRLLTEHTTLPALQMAIATRNGQSLYGVIVHSDGGGQYYDKAFLSLTQSYGMRNSMCEYAWENGKAERINGVIKNNYLIHRNVRSYEQLIKEVDRSVQLYNCEKPHISLKRLTPIEFESMYFYTQEIPVSHSMSNKKQVKQLYKTVNPI